MFVVKYFNIGESIYYFTALYTHCKYFVCNKDFCKIKPAEKTPPTQHELT